MANASGIGSDNMAQFGKASEGVRTMGPQSGASVITEVPSVKVITCGFAYTGDTKIVPQHQLEHLGYTYHLFASCIQV